MNLSLNHLLDYTEWQRKRWHDSLRNYGEPVLQISAGPNGDGRFEVIGDLIRHIFSAEKRYVERLSGRALTQLPRFSALFPGNRRQVFSHECEF